MECQKANLFFFYFNRRWPYYGNLLPRAYHRRLKFGTLSQAMLIEWRKPFGQFCKDEEGQSCGPVLAQLNLRAVRAFVCKRDWYKTIKSHKRGVKLHFDDHSRLVSILWWIWNTRAVIEFWIAFPLKQIIKIVNLIRNLKYQLNQNSSASKIKFNNRTT